MLIKTVVLGSQDGLLHDIRNLLNRDDGATFLTEFADQIPIGGVNAQGDLRLIVGQNLQRGKIRVGQDEHHGDHGAGHEYQTGEQQDRIENPA